MKRNNRWTDDLSYKKRRVVLLELSQFPVKPHSRRTHRRHLPSGVSDFPDATLRESGLEL